MKSKSKLKKKDMNLHINLAKLKDITPTDESIIQIRSWEKDYSTIFERLVSKLTLTHGSRTHTLPNHLFISCKTDIKLEIVKELKLCKLYGIHDYHSTVILASNSELKDKPLLAFINLKSGNQTGAHLQSEFLKVLDSRQVIEISSVGPYLGLLSFRNIPKFYTYACGGDGTASWLFSAISTLRAENLPDFLTMTCKNPHTGIVPLGTGNDLSRHMGFGPSTSRTVTWSRMLKDLYTSKEQKLDRWRLQWTPKTAMPLKLRTPDLNNYISFGFDADLATDFHEFRDGHSEFFNSRTMNKAFYGMFAVKQQFVADSLRGKIELYSNGNLIEIPKSTIALVFLNIQSYYGGRNPWKGKSSSDDGKIEVIGLSLGRLYGLAFKVVNGNSIAQVDRMTIRVLKTVSAKVDGEPVCQKDPCDIEISKLDVQQNILKCPRNNQNIFL